ncbi:hypothetical protein [Microcoleus sp. B3-D7]|uniref:hypothetical protein n=1 Tax=Microcoleus sp. B3-D7 TaxID=2818659 RepID=UPI002FD12DB8
MTILPSSTSKVAQFPENPRDHSTEFLNSQIPWKPSDRILEEALAKLINLDEIVDRLYAIDFHHCAPYTPQQVRFAFLKWVENHLESIEQQPEWFLKENSKHFDKHLPEIDGYWFPEEEYDQECLHEAMAQEELARQTPAQNASNLEDEFMGTPQEAAQEALNW